MRNATVLPLPCDAGRCLPRAAGASRRLKTCRTSASGGDRIVDVDFDVDPNLVLDGNVDLDPLVDLDLAPSTIPDEDSGTPGKSRCKVEGGVSVYVAVQRQRLATTSTSNSTSPEGSARLHRTTPPHDSTTRLHHTTPVRESAPTSSADSSARSSRIVRLARLGRDTNSARRRSPRRQAGSRRSNAPCELR
jgi:hypothetical protein